MSTKRQKQILDFIRSFIKKNDYSPSLEEIKKHFGLSSFSTIHFHIEKLKNAGYLTKEDNISRSINVQPEERLFQVPLVGKIAAGYPIEALETTNETIGIPAERNINFQNLYALKVSGDSMIDDGIFNGDVVVIKKQNTAENGQTVVAIVDDNKATLKKLYKEKNIFRLQPANQLIMPIYSKNVEIRGVVVKIVRNFENSSLNTDEIFEERKTKFLNIIKSTNPNSMNKYKRIVESPLRYAGGKSLAVGYVVELLPKNIRRIISPFFGGGSIEIACSKYLGLEVVGFDIFDILINYWQQQIKNPTVLFKKLSKLKPDQDTYAKIKVELKKHWDKKKKLAPLDLATHYYFNHNLSYGPGFLGWASKVYMNEKRYKAMLEKVKNFAPQKLEVKCGSFEEAFEKYPNDFFYCDPPYFLGEDSKMFIGIYPMRNFPVHHNGFDHEKLRDLLKKHKGGFILSYNNCNTIRSWYKDFKHYFPEWQYTMGQGETRIGKNRINSKINHIKESHEIMIFCPPRVQN